MNSLYTSGVRQTNSLQADMEKLRSGDNSPALLGELNDFFFGFRYNWLTDEASVNCRTDICVAFCYAPND